MLFLAAHVPAGDLWRYLRHQYAGMAELALKQAIEQQYLDWLPMVLAAGYDDCALLNQVSTCSASGNMPQTPWPGLGKSTALS